MQAFRSGIVPARANSRDATWLRWTQYCSELGVDPFLTDIEDYVPILQVFAHRYRCGQLSASHKPVRSRTVEAALRAIGQTMASVGAQDKRHTSDGTPHYRLQQQLRGYARLDPPADRVKPIPFPIIHHLTTVASDDFSRAVADVAILGFFFMLRPGEHTVSTATADTTPFTLADVTFKVGATIVPATSGPLDLIQLATFVTLRFTRQKNGTENEIIGHARSNHLTTCPVLAVVRRCLHLRHYHAPDNTALCTVFATNCPPRHVTAAILTTHLRASATALLPTTGFPPAEISARALRAGGAMALLCAQVDSDVIRLIGRWKSDEMFRYLHPQAYSLMHTFAPLMTKHGDFRLLTAQPSDPTPPAV